MARPPDVRFWQILLQGNHVVLGKMTTDMRSGVMGATHRYRPVLGRYRG